MQFGTHAELWTRIGPGGKHSDFEDCAGDSALHGEGSLWSSIEPGAGPIEGEVQFFFGSVENHAGVRQKPPCTPDSPDWLPTALPNPER